jgi:hypothetical protein
MKFTGSKGVLFEPYKMDCTIYEKTGRHDGSNVLI